MWRYHILLWSLCAGIQVNIPANAFTCNTMSTHTYVCMWHYVLVFFLKIQFDNYWCMCRYVQVSLSKIHAQPSIFYGEFIAKTQPPGSACQGGLSRGISCAAGPGALPTSSSPINQMLVFSALVHQRWPPLSILICRDIVANEWTIPQTSTISLSLTVVKSVLWLVSSG